MRKLLCLTAILISSITHAQMAIGPELGLNISNVSGGSETFSLGAGIRAGMSLDVQLADHLYLQPGLMYSVKGGSYRVENSQNLASLGGLSGLLGTGSILDSFGNSLSPFTTVTTEENVSYTFQYLQVPVLAVYKLEMKDEGNLFFGFGPYVSWLVAGRYQRSAVTSLAGLNINNNEDRALLKGTEVNSIDFGLNVNLGYLHRSGMFCRGFYEMGLTDNGIGKNMSFGLSMGYYFGSAKGAP